MPMRKVALIGGPAAGDVMDSESSRIMVPVFNALAVVMPKYIPPLIKGFVTYQIKRVRFGYMTWFVAQPEDSTDPVSLVAILAGARPKMHVFGKQK